MERVIMNNHEPPMHLAFFLLRCYATETTSSYSLTCIYDRESMSLEPSSSAILRRERANKVSGKRSSRLLHCFFKFFITTCLPFCRMHVKGRRLQRELHQADHRGQGTISHVRFLLSDHVLHIGYIDPCRHDFAR
jgi:hypothetical protein